MRICASSKIISNRKYRRKKRLNSLRKEKRAFTTMASYVIIIAKEYLAEE